MPQPYKYHYILEGKFLLHGYSEMASADNLRHILDPLTSSLLPRLSGPGANSRSSENRIFRSAPREFRAPTLEAFPFKLLRLAGPAY